MSNAKLWRGLATITAILLVVAMGLSTMADALASFLNSRLGTSNYVTRVNEDEEANGDGTYFDSEFSTLDDLIQAETDLARELGREGTVLLKNNGALPLDKSSETVTLWG